jgi:hypothetical protein
VPISRFLPKIFFFFRRFTIGAGGTLTATIGPRQAIAVYKGAYSTAGSSVVQQVSVIFSETATTTYGEVSVEFLFARPGGLASCALGYFVLGLARSASSVRPSSMLTVNHVIEYFRGGQRAATR